MLVRNGWVSNSSTSSFVVVYKCASDFFKLHEFRGYNTLCRSLVGGFGELTESVPTVAHILLLGLDQFKERLPTGGYSCDDEVYDILQTCPDEDWDERAAYASLLSEILNKWQECMEACEDNREVVLEELNSWYFSSAVYDRCHDVCDKLATVIVNYWKAQGYTVKVLEYGDDDLLEYDEAGVDGAFMEWQFMPWIKNNPDRDYSVFILNGH